MYSLLGSFALSGLSLKIGKGKKQPPVCDGCNSILKYKMQEQRLK